MLVKIRLMRVIFPYLVLVALGKQNTIANHTAQALPNRQWLLKVVHLGYQ